jgi:hypothetical protein
MPILLAVVSVIIIVFLYVGTMLLNDHAGVPEGCEQAYMEAQECESCNISGSEACPATSDDMFKDAIEFMKEVKI